MKTDEQSQDCQVSVTPDPKHITKLPTQLLPWLLPLFVAPGDALSQPLQIFLSRKQTPHIRYICVKMHPTGINMCATGIYMLITYGVGSLLVVELPGLELLDSFFHSNFSHFHSLLQGYELSLPGRLHPSVVVVHRGGGLAHRLGWTGGNRRLLVKER